MENWITYVNQSGACEPIQARTVEEALDILETEVKSQPHEEDAGSVRIQVENTTTGETGYRDIY